HKPQRGSSGLETAYGEKILSPQTTQSPPEMGRISARHCRQTGRREILIRGELQIRQSPGNNTVNRLSVNWPAQKATEVPCPADFAWAARIRFPLLLKTASLMPADSPDHRRATRVSSTSSIAVLRFARQRYGWRNAAPNAAWEPFH